MNLDWKPTAYLKWKNGVLLQKWEAEGEIQQAGSSIADEVLVMAKVYKWERVPDCTLPLG